MSNIEPLGGLILVKEIEQRDKTTASGLVLTSSTMDSELKRGKIVSVGPGERDQTGVTHRIPLDIGMVVIYSEGHGTEVTDSLNNKYQFVNWRNLFGVENNG
jgi:chaperonin GroES